MLWRSASASKMARISRVELIFASRDRRLTVSPRRRPRPQRRRQEPLWRLLASSSDAFVTSKVCGRRLSPPAGCSRLHFTGRVFLHHFSGGPFLVLGSQLLPQR